LTTGLMAKALAIKGVYYEKHYTIASERNAGQA